MKNETLFWSIRREIWENRSIYVGPLVASVLCMFGYMISTIGMPHRRRALLLLDPAKQRAIVAEPYDGVAMMLIVLSVIIGLYYCLDSLYGERRDRSILFWKSLPVSDRTTVISKALIPLAVLPAITFVVIVCTQFMMLIWSTIVLAPSGLGLTTWSRFNIVWQSWILLYGVIVLALWYAPIYGWFMLMSAWAKRAPVLWAILPIFGFGILDHIITHGAYFAPLMKYRLMGFVNEAFDYPKHGQIESIRQLTLGSFLAAPGLWVGLALAALFFAGAMRLRRYREPI